MRHMHVMGSVLALATVAMAQGFTSYGRHCGPILTGKAMAVGELRQLELNVTEIVLVEVLAELVEYVVGSLLGHKPEVHLGAGYSW